MARTATRNRSTKETSIEVSINVDGSGQSSVSTGIPFYDHMLDQLARHGGFDLTVAAKVIYISILITQSKMLRLPLAKHCAKRSGTKQASGVLLVAHFHWTKHSLRYRSISVGVHLFRGMLSCQNACHSEAQLLIRPWQNTRSHHWQRPQTLHCMSICEQAEMCITSSRQHLKDWLAAYEMQYALTRQEYRPQRAFFRDTTTAYCGARLRNRQSALGAKSVRTSWGSRSSYDIAFPN